MKNKFLSLIDDLRSQYIAVLVSFFVLASILLLSWLTPKLLLKGSLALVIVLLPFALAIAVVISRWPGVGLCIIVFSGLGIPIALNTGTQTSINSTILMVVLSVGLWLLGIVFGQFQLQLIPSKTTLPLLLMDLCVVLALINGQLPWFWGAGKAPITAQLGGAFLFFLSSLAFLLAANQVKKILWLKWMEWSFMGIGSVYLLSRIIPPLGSLTSKLFQSGATGSIFWVWITSLAFSQAALNRELSKKWRGFLIIVVGISLYVGLIQQRDWTSGWLPVVVALFAIVGLAWPKSLPAIGIIGALLVSSKISSIQALIMGGDNVYSLMTRLQAWQIISEMLKVSPVLGLGPANYHFYTQLFPILGYSVQFNSHNNYVDIIAQIGLLGLACFLWFAFVLFKEGFEIRNRVGNGFERAYVYGALGG
jgi:hypothetical protein